MTNLDSILKSRVITLPTRVCIVKAMVFPVVMYGCESWTIKKAEDQRIDVFELWCWRSLLSPLDCKKIKPVNHKRNQSWIFIRRTDAEGPILWPSDVKSQLIRKGPDAGKDEGRRRRGWQRTRWLDGITDLMDMILNKLQKTVKDREAWHAIVPRVTKSWIWLSDWTTTIPTAPESLTCVYCSHPPNNQDVRCNLYWKI